MAERERRTQELLRSSEASVVARKKAARSAWSIGLNKVGRRAEQASPAYVATNAAGCSDKAWRFPVLASEGTHTHIAGGGAPPLRSVPHR